MFTTHCEDEVEGGPSTGGDSGRYGATSLADAAALEQQEFDGAEGDGRVERLLDRLEEAALARPRADQGLSPATQVLQPSSAIIFAQLVFLELSSSPNFAISGSTAVASAQCLYCDCSSLNLAAVGSAS